MDELSALLDQMTPEEFQQLLSLSTLGQQEQQAQALGGQQAPQHSTMLGGILGGLGAGGSNLAGGLKMNQLMGQRQSGLQQLLGLLKQKPGGPAASPMGDYDADDMAGMMG